MVVMQKEESAESKPALANERKGEGQKKSEVVVFLGPHNADYIKKLTKLTGERLPAYIVVEDVPDKDFPKMLKGDIDVEKYVNERPYFFKEHVIELFKLLVELHDGGNGVQVKQIDAPSDLRWVRLPPFPLTFDTEAEVRIDNKMSRGDFDKAVNSMMSYRAIDAATLDDRNRKRDEWVGDELDKGKLSGYVLILGGKLHSFFKNRLKSRFRDSDNVSIDAIYTTTEDAKEVFGRWAQDVYSPLEELSHLYEQGVYGPLNEKWKEKWADRWRRDGYENRMDDDRTRRGKVKDAVSGLIEGNYGDKRERLLGARSVLMLRVLKDPSDTDKSWVKTVNMVNQIPTYKQCKEFFDEMNAQDMDEKAAFKFLEEHVKTRKY
jgi:hypothetical protein